MSDAKTTTSVLSIPEKTESGLAYSESEYIWRLEPHVCRHCFARIASAKAGHGRLYRCTNCGLEGESGRPSVVCACGIKLRKARADGRSGEAVIDAGVRCHPNPDPSPANPALYVASYAVAEGKSD